MLWRQVCGSALVFCRSTVQVEKSGAALQQHIVCGLLCAVISWWKWRVVLVALELLWGLKATGCQGVWLVFSSSVHFFWWAACVHRLLLTSAPLKLSVCRRLWRLTMDHIIKKKKRKKQKKIKKEVFPCTEVSFLYSSEPLLHCGYYIVYTFKPWWITRSLISFIYERMHFLWIQGCHLASLSFMGARSSGKSPGGEFGPNNTLNVSTVDLFSTALFSTLFWC